MTSRDQKQFPSARLKQVFFAGLLALASASLASAGQAQSQSAKSDPLFNKTSPSALPMKSPAPGMSSVVEDELPKLRGIEPENKEKLTTLDDLAHEVTKSAGSIFVDEDNVFVKPPLLTSLITLNETVDPYALDALSGRPVGLRDVLMQSLRENLPIKISQSDMMKEKWIYYGALSQFLPSLTNALGYQGIKGNYVSPAGLSIPISNPYFTTASGFNQYLFKGGAILHTALEDKHAYKASRYQLRGTINDILLDTAAHYYDLVRADVLLQIRVKAVEVSKALLLVNQDLFDNGVNTQLDVLQAKYQLSADRQHLIKQQVERRKQAVKLANVLNADTGIDLNVSNRLVSKVRLVDKSLRPADLLRIAIDRRPELKRYDELRMAAKEAIKVARAALLPSIAVAGNVIGTGSNAVSSGSLATNQQTTLSSNGISAGAVSSSAGLPLASNNGQGRPSWTTRSLFTIGVNVEWNLGGLGLAQISQVRASQWQARSAQLEFQRELEKITKEVRDAYLSSISAEQLIIETTAAVKYAEEGLRLAELRFQEGVGTYLDVINAQHSYTDSLIDKANALIDFDEAQVRLVHALGVTTVDTLTASVPLKEPARVN